MNTMSELSTRDTKRILIVENDKPLLDMYAAKFSEAGFEVEPSFGGMDALSKLEDGFRPDVILADLEMPVMGGLEFLREVRAKNLTPGAKIVVLSDLGEKEDMEKAAALGISGHVVKSAATPTEVVERVREIIDGEKV